MDSSEFQLENVYAVNSASTIKVSALKAVGGYDPRLISISPILPFIIGFTVRPKGICRWKYSCGT
jgi:hypothetical protein